MDYGKIQASVATPAPIRVKLGHYGEVICIIHLVDESFQITSQPGHTEGISLYRLD